MVEHVTLIGFGEAGQAFAGSNGWRGQVRAYDRLTDTPATASEKHEDYRKAGVVPASDIRTAVDQASVIISLVTADQALVVAQHAAGSLNSDAFYLDMNSVAPATKQAAAAFIDAAGGRYVDVAIMSPVNPARLAVPLLVSGPEAARAAGLLAELGFSDVRIVGQRVGEASAIKMIRSVIVKGIEALTAEAMLAAVAAGVTEEVLASLDASERSWPWPRRADYNLDRMMVHGQRRAEEMEEVVKALEGLGVEPILSRATARWQRDIGKLRLGTPPAGLASKLDRINARKADAA